MNMYVLYGAIPVRELLDCGFKIKKHDYLSSLKYNDDEALVHIERYRDGNYVTDISQNYGKHNKNVIRKLYEIFGDIKIMDETTVDYADFLHLDETIYALNEEYKNNLLEKMFKHSKEKIFSQD